MPRLRLVPFRALVVLFVVLVVAVPGLLPASAAAPPGPGEVLVYQPPVAAEVVEPFRPPAHRYGSGNRGIDYATDPSSPVGAAARGVVAFAGQVGGDLHVTVLHPDGIRTTYSFLRSIGVRRGALVERGEELGRSHDRLHFGARLGDDYLDPRSLFGRSRPHVRLVPDHKLRPAAEATERRFVRQLLRRVSRVVRAGAGAGAAAAKAQFTALAAGHRELAQWLGAVGELSPSEWARLGVALATATGDSGPCTPAERAPPVGTGRRRLLVLVGGVGSSSASAGIEALDTRGLGYADEDVHRFSYRGGTVAERPYATADTTADIGRSGARLAALLRRLAARHPGTPIDVVAHSLGGLVARSALAGPGAPAASRAVRTLVTLGTPHEGADLAATVRMARANPTVRAGEHLIRTLRLADLDGDAPALGQLVPGSAFLRDLARRRLPGHVAVTSVAARADVMVASSRSRLPGARNTVVTVGGVHDHALLPGSPAAQREIALAVAGAPPTCRSRADAALDALADGLVRRQQLVLGPALRLDLPLRPVG